MNASGTAPHHARRVVDLVPRQGLHRRQVGGRRGPDELLAGGGGEERAPHRLLLDQVQEVGRVARELATGGAAQLGAQAAPGGGAQAPVLLRVGRAQQRRGGLAHGVVDQQPAGGQLHERQLAQAGEGLGRRLVGQHRGEQREGRPARQRRGVQRAPRRLVETVEVDARQLLADRAGGDLLDRQARAVAQRPGRELEAQRVAVGDGVDAPRGLVVDAVAAQQLVGLLGRQVAERDRAQQRPVAAPALERRVAAADHDAHVGRQGREHRAARASGRASPGARRCRGSGRRAHRGRRPPRRPPRRWCRPARPGTRAAWRRRRDRRARPRRRRPRAPRPRRRAGASSSRRRRGRGRRRRRARRARAAAAAGRVRARGR